MIGWVRFIGVLSYSLYLVHQVFIKARRYCETGRARHKHPDGDRSAKTLLADCTFVCDGLSVPGSAKVVLERPAARMRKRYSSTPRVDAS